MICPECGKKLPEDAGFCIRCGANQNNPKAEVYKKTRTAEQLEEPTVIGNIIPDETEKILPEDNDTSDSEPILKTEKDATEFDAERDNEKFPENDDDEDDDDEDDDRGKSTRLAVLSVVCVILLVACIVVYFFTRNTASGNDNTDVSDVESVTTTVLTSVSYEQTTYQETTTAETITETLPPETSVVTDANGNSYDIVLSNDIQAVVKLDEGNLRLRAYPSTDATVLGIMANGEQVTIKGSCGEWYYIVSGDRTGYASMEFIAPDEPENTSAVADTTSESEISESVTEISE